VSALKRTSERARTKLALLRLADELGSVVRACQLMGYSRGSYYRIRARYLEGGEELLGEANRRAPERAVNRLDPGIEAIVVELSLAHPEWGRRRLMAALAARGIPISASGVRCVWKRRGLLTARQRGKLARSDTGASENSLTA
jgi:transposase